MAHIMLVDDEDALAESLRAALEHDGHRVSVAHDGAEALQTLGLEPEQPGAELPDLILLDVMMPRVDGYAVNAKLFKSERTKNVPVIILTARSEMRDLFDFATKGRVFLPKPFEYKDLKGHIGRILGPKA